MPKHKNKKSKTTDAEVSHIAAAIMPSAGLAAAPKTPVTIVAEPESSGVLSTSLLGRMFATQPEPEPQASETDTSLIDYENAGNTLTPNYQMVYSKSRSLPVPQTSYGRPPNISQDNIQDEVEGRIARHHTLPLSSEQREARPLSQLTMTSELTTVSSVEDDEESPRIVRDYQRKIMQDQLQDTITHTETLRHSVEADRSHHSTLPRSRTPQDLLTTAKLRDLQRTNLELLRVQQELQEKLQQQQLVQDEILHKLQNVAVNATNNPDQTLTQEATSILHDTTSVTDQTSKQHTQLIQCLHERTDILEEEKLEMRTIIEQLRDELDNRQADGQPDEQLIHKMKELQAANDVLRSAVHRLTSELGNKLSRHIGSTQNRGIPNSGPTPSWIINTEYIAPLFVAYDDQINHQAKVIQQYQDNYAEIKEQIEVIITENNRLHAVIADQMPTANWRQLREQCALVVEENQVIMEQIKLQEEKYRHQQQTHTKQVAELASRLATSEAEKTVDEREMEEMKRKCRELKEKTDEYLIDKGMMNRVSEHLREVEELKRLTEEDRIKSGSVIEKLESDLKISQIQQHEQNVAMKELIERNNQLEQELRNMKKSTRKSQKKVLVMQQAISSTKTEEEITAKYLNKVVKVAEKTALERDTFLQTTQAQDLQLKKALDEVTESKLIVAKMQEKMQANKAKCKEKVEKAMAKLEAQEQTYMLERAEFERELKQLRLLLNDKDNDLNLLSNEKRLIQDDLESVWQATTRDNKVMRESFKKSLSKLRERGTLHTVIPEPKPDTDSFNIDDYLSDHCDKL